MIAQKLFSTHGGCVKSFIDEQLWFSILKNYPNNPGKNSAGACKLLSTTVDSQLIETFQTIIATASFSCTFPRCLMPFVKKKKKEHSRQLASLPSGVITGNYACAGTCRR